MRLRSLWRADVPRHVARLAVLLLTAALPRAAAAAPDLAADVGIERFGRVDDHLYRGAQPTAEGFRRLRDLGVRVIVNLRMEEDSKRTNERQIVESLGLRYVQLPVEDGNFFTRSRRIPEDVIRDFFTLFDARDNSPVFVHCHRGADRTGALVAFYRIARQGWDNQRALKEARDLGMRSWYAGLQDQILRFSAAAFQIVRPAGSQ